MSTALQEERVAAAQAYEALFVPALFHQWAAPVASAAGIRLGSQVLDVGCGTGVLTREAARRAGPTGSVTGLDLAPGMLEVARRQLPTVTWVQGSADHLPFADATFDQVVSQFALMFFPERERALQEMQRVLRPGGVLAVAVWDTLETMPAYADEVSLLERLAGKRAADALRAPFVLGDRRELTRLAQSAGIQVLRVESFKGRAKFPSVRVLVEADLRGWLPLVGVPLPEAKIAEILGAAEEDLAAYATREGTAEFDISVHLLSGTKA